MQTKLIALSSCVRRNRDVHDKGTLGVLEGIHYYLFILNQAF